MSKMNSNNMIFSDAVSDALSTAVVVLDKSLNIQHINAAAENLFGQSRARVIKKPYTALLKAEMVKEHLQHVLETKPKANIRNQHEYSQPRRKAYILNPEISVKLTKG